MNDEQELQDQTKACRDCGEMLPLKNFGRDRNQADGKKTICRSCWQLRQEKAKVQSEQALKHKFSKEFADAVLNNKAAPETADLLEGIVSAFGGAEAFCREFVADYYASEPGSATRKRAQEVVVRMSEKHTERVFSENDIRAMNDEELEAVLQARISNAIIKTEHYQSRKRENKKRRHA